MNTNKKHFKTILLLNKQFLKMYPFVAINLFYI